MSPLAEKLEGLSAERRVALEKLLRKRASARDNGPELRPRTADGPVPLSFAQTRLWFLDRLHPGSSAYNMTYAPCLRGALDPRALAAAHGALVRRHEALRTTFAEHAGGPVQVVHPPAPFPLPLVDLRGLAAPHRQAEALRLVEHEAAVPFDLECGPVFRATLLWLEEEEHVLLFTLHHIAGDTWSVTVLQREVSAFYEACARGAEPGLPPLPIQYPDYAAWQRAWLSGAELERQLAYWRERLAGAPPVLELPTDRARPAMAGDRGAYLAFDLAPAQTAALRALARGANATVFMVLLAAWQALLARWAATDDVVVGTPVAGRTRVETEGLIGFFANTLVLRTDLSGDPTVRELLACVRETTLGAFAHQEFPFEKLVEELAPERSLAHSPLFQVMIVLGTLRGGSALPDGSPTGALDAAVRTAKFDLNLQFADLPGQLAGGVEYRTELFDEATVGRMLGHFTALLDGMMADPEARLSAIPLLGAAERRRVVEEWNATVAAYPTQATTHALFEAQAARTPGAAAVVHAGGTLSFAELEGRANRLARHLRGRGVGPDVRVGLCLERGPEMMVAVLAILKAGGAYVPLDAKYPADRLEYMLRDSGAPVLVTQASLAGALPETDAVVVRVDGDAGAIAAEPAGRLESGTLPDHLAYVIYTSGSTGRPKGVAMPHRPLVNLLAWQERDWHHPGPAVQLQFATISFDASFHELFSAWQAGGCVVLVDDETRHDPAALLALVERGGVDRVFMPAVALQQLAETAVSGGIVPPTLRELQTAGEALRITGPIRAWHAALGAPLFNHYGPSETHVVTSLALEGDPAAWPLLPTIGRPIANTRCYVLDARLQPSPIGVPGELYLGGVSLARGYLGRPALTAEKFVPDPFAAEPGGRLYRTGDRVRWLADGTLAFLGRTDDQVKLRGFRIEPGEIEAVLETHPAVKEAAVIVREDAPGDRRLAAYVVAAEGESVSAAALRAHVKERLPDYMVPAAFVALDAMPLTPSGKVARRALPAPVALEEEAYVAPRTATEEILAGIYAEVLGRARVGAEDGFFDLGGHSLLATRLVSRIRAAFAVELPLRAVFEAPTVAALGARVDELRRAGAAPAAPPLVPVSRAAPLPLSFSQTRLWFLDRLQPGSAIYNMPYALRLRGALDTAALARAFTALAARHEVLRTTFAEREGEPVQVIHPPAPVPLPVFDLAALADDVREAEAERRVGEEAARPFDLARGPLLRTTLLRLGEEDHVLLVSLHHVVTDGWSTGVLVHELSALYAGQVRGEEPDLAPLPVQYADFAAWQRSWLKGEVLDAQIAYWKTQLAGAPPVLDLPTDYSRRPGLHARAATASMAIPDATARALRELARREGATLFMVLLAGWQALLARYSGDDDVVVGTPIAGRTRLELEGLVGFFVNMLALRAEAGDDPTFSGLVGRVREASLGAYAHQDLPFERLVDALEIERSLTHSPVFQVAFGLERSGGGGGSGDVGLVLGETRLEPFSGGEATARYDLTLTVVEEDERLHAMLQYATALFTAETPERMLRHLGVLLESVAADPGRRLWRIPLLAGAEREAVLAGVDANSAAGSPRGCVHLLFAAQAGRTPGVVAVVSGGETLTYAELDARANRLARWLRGRGVGLEARVGICLERCLELPAVLLAVLKAGAAYVPLDPGYPAARLAGLVADAALPLLITSERLRGRVPATAAEVHLLERVWAEAAKEEETDPGVEVPPEALAYVIYTSGSTGRPKGVAVPHAGVVNYLSWAVEAYGLEEGSRAPVHSPLVFDLTVTSLFGPLVSGGTVVLVPEGEGIEGLAAALREGGRAGLVKLTPAHLALLERQLSPVHAASAASTFIVGGEPLASETVAAWLRLAPETEIVNEYGPTETVVGCCVHRVGPKDAAGAVVPIGRPIAHTALYVLDRVGGVLPPGVIGELYIGGAGVARGYLGQPALTAQRFVPDPFGGGRLYRSGDLVRRLADGSLEFHGRADDQVKVRGFRIELGEVEAALLDHPRVRESVVMARGEGDGRRLVAWIVPCGEGVSAAELRAHLASRLPGHMVPSALALLDALPLTRNGKVDRRALAEPDGGDRETVYVPPRDALELAVAGVWEEVLGVRPVGVRDDFFSIGGHSLLAVRMLAQVERRTGARLPVAALFAGPTVERLAAAVRQGEHPPASPLVPVQPSGTRPPLFFVHPAGGNVLAYAALARRLGADQPFYALQSRGLQPDEPAHDRVEAMAADYLEQLCAVQPAGPYRLGGWSMGGVVAYEMARQLRARGDEVALLALVDAVAPALVGSAEPPDPLAALAGFALHLGLPPERVGVSAEQARALDPEARLARVRAVALEAGVVPPDLDDAAFRRLYHVYEANTAALRRYVPGPYPGSVLLFRADGTSDLLGWDGVAGPVAVVPVAGDHFQLLNEPHAGVIAAALASALEAIEGPATAGL